MRELPAGSCESNHIRCCESQSGVLTDVSRAYFHAKVKPPVLVKLSAEDCAGKDKWEDGLLKKACTTPEMQQAIWKYIGTGILKVGVYELGAQFKKLVP